MTVAGRAVWVAGGPRLRGSFQVAAHLHHAQLIAWLRTVERGHPSPFTALTSGWKGLSIGKQHRSKQPWSWIHSQVPTELLRLEVKTKSAACTGLPRPASPHCRPPTPRDAQPRTRERRPAVCSATAKASRPPRSGQTAPVATAAKAAAAAWPDSARCCRHMSVCSLPPPHAQSLWLCLRCRAPPCRARLVHVLRQNCACCRPPCACCLPLCACCLPLCACCPPTCACCLPPPPPRLCAPPPPPSCRIAVLRRRRRPAAAAHACGPAATPAPNPAPLSRLCAPTMPAGTPMRATLESPAAASAVGAAPPRAQPRGCRGGADRRAAVVVRTKTHPRPQSAAAPPPPPAAGPWPLGGSQCPASGRAQAARVKG
eukprot:364282-Chlamydomonas_euryale.AAC.33